GNVTSDSTLGYRASGVPGSVSGFEYASKKFGSKPWKALLAPAIDLAAKGFPLSYAQAQSLRASARTLSRFPESNRIFLRGGRYYEAGELFVQQDLAHTLDRIAIAGARDFYEGTTAGLLARDMAAHGGLITEADLREYRTIERRPLTGKYRS